MAVCLPGHVNEPDAVVCRWCGARLLRCGWSIVVAVRCVGQYAFVEGPFVSLDCLSAWHLSVVPVPGVQRYACRHEVTLPELGAVRITGMDILDAMGKAYPVWTPAEITIVGRFAG